MRMTSVEPDISVVIPAHNGGRYLAECIQSVLDQKHAALDILVIDNASTDDTADVARAFPSVRYLYLADKGLCKALNHGIEQSRGALLGFLDADDLWSPSRLAVPARGVCQQPGSRDGIRARRTVHLARTG